MRKRPIKILLVEDNEGDILLTTEAMKEFKLPYVLQTLRDGNEAIEFLVAEAQKNVKNLPDLILLDVNLPKKNGHEVLQTVKNHPDLRHIPIIMLTTSSSDVDILRAYQEHANCYIIKPLEVNDFLNVTSKIEEFWFNLVKLPRT